jgi:predicted kinase
VFAISDILWYILAKVYVTKQVLSNSFMKKIALISIGIPGSGKTSTLSPLAEKYGLARISRDDIRKEWFGDSLLQVDKEEVEQEAHRRVAEALASDKPVLKDSTFVEREKRTEAIGRLKKAGAVRIIGIVFTTPLAIAKERNRNRQAQVDEAVIDLLQTQLESEPPSLDEGFDALYTDAQLTELEENELSFLLKPTGPASLG